MTEVARSEASVKVWLNKNGDGPLHKGRAIEYDVEIEDGMPQSYQRSLYEDGELLTSGDFSARAAPEYVRDEVEKHMIPKGAWPS